MATNGGITSTINLSDGWGCGLAGTFVALVFYGISILQTFLYYERYTKDGVVLKSLVAWVFVLNTLYTFIVSVGMWEYFIIHFGDDEFLASVPVPLPLTVLVTSMISTTVQSFFAYRIWSLMRSRFRWLFLAILMSFVVAQLVLGSFFTIVETTFQTSVAAMHGSPLNEVVNALNGIATVVDITITICLCMLLAKDRTGFAVTDRMLLRLIIVSVNTGLWSSLFAFLIVILRVVFPSHLISTIVYAPLCAVYCNTLLANLNVRSFVRGDNETQQTNPPSSLVYLRTFTSADAGASLERREVAGIEPPPAVNV